jgi:hypothetical protein
MTEPRGRAARERAKLKRESAFPNKSFRRAIRHCEILEVVGPEDATSTPEKVRELYHIFVRVRTPMESVITVPMDGSIHSILSIDGNAESLVGRTCTVHYLGHSIEDAEARGVARIERDMTIRIPAEKAALSLAGLLGMITGNHGDVGKESDGEFKGEPERNPRKKRKKGEKERKGRERRQPRRRRG